jgi:hypothetical protein
MSVIAKTALVWADDRLRAFAADDGRRLWEAPALGLPAPTETLKLAIGAGAVVVPSSEGFVQRDLITGAAHGRSAVSGLAPGGVATTVGAVVVYRVGDEVHGYG